MKRKHTLRNLLSMVCVIAMVISMVPVLPAAAADETVGSAQAGGVIGFVDANEIVNTEAVAITAGMGLFAGTTEGKFDPAGTVTRAQMATIIVKMLRGNDFNADNFKGINKFSDTAAFEGGWAEGYINACVQMGVVAGYGDGTFKPGKAVTTAEALTMIINALKVDAGAGEWPTTIMAKAQEMKLYGDLAVKPGTYDALTRDQLAVLAYEGMCYSPAGVSGYKVPGSDIVFKDIADALKVCADPSLITEVMGEDALATKVYELKTFEGFITANQATGEDEYTTVTAYNADGRTAPVSVDFNMETGLAQIGHYVTVYYREEYKNDTEPGQVYNYVDETQVITVDEDITTSKKYKEAFGKSIKEAALLSGSDAVLLIAGDYTTSVTDNSTRGSIAGYNEGTAAKEGTYLINDGVVKAYMAPIPVYAAKVRAVNTYEGNETIELSGVAAPIDNSEGNDCIREYNGIAKDDYVTYTVVGTGVNAIYVLTKTTSATGIVSKTYTNDDGENVISVNGVDYVQFGGTNNITEFQGQVPVNYTDSYTIILTEDGKYLGWERPSGALNLDDTVFILGELSVVVDDGYGGKIRKTTARGVDMSGNEVNLLLKVEKNGSVNSNGVYIPSRADGDTVADPGYTSLAGNTFYTYKLSNDKDAKKEEIYTLTAYPTAYDEKTAPIYAGSRTIGVDVTYLNWNFGYNGKVTSENTNCLYILIEGTADQPTPLTPTVAKNWGTATNHTGAPLQSYYIFSRDSKDMQLAEVMVMVAAQNSVAAKASEPYYVAEDSRKPVGVDSNGYVYDVYDYLTGEKKQISLKTTDALLVDVDGDGVKSEIPTVGYWHTLPDTDSVCKVLVGQVTDTASGSTTTSGTTADSSTNDGLYGETILHNQQFDQIARGELYTTNLTRGKNYAGAAVVDTRSEDEIAAFGFGKIDSFSRLESLLKDNEDLVIIFDLCYSTLNDRVATIFTREVYYASQEGGAEIKNVGGIYYLDGRPIDANTVTINDVSGNVSGSTTADKLNDLATKVAAGYIVDAAYTMANGKVGAITINSFMKPGIIWEETFDTYANGAYDYNAAGSTLVPRAATMVAGDNKSADIVDGVLNVSLTGAAATSSNRIWLATRKNDFNDSYTIEFRFKSNNAGNLTNVRLTGVNVGGSNYQLRFYDNQFVVYVTDANKYTSAAAFDFSQWHVVKIHVSEPTPDAVDSSVILEIFDDNGTLLDTHSFTSGVASTASMFSFEPQSKANETRTDSWDYIVVKDYEYSVASYGVTVDDTADNGLLSADRISAPAGDTVTFTTTAQDGYKLNKLLVNGNDILVSNNNLNSVVETQYTMPAEDITVKAEFAKIAAYAVSIPAVAGGTVTVTANGDPVADGAEIMEGTLLTITATPDQDWNCNGILLDGAPVQGSVITMPGKDIVISAEFTQAPPEHNVAVGTGFIDGTVTLSHTGSVQEGTQITVTATPTKAGFECKTIYVNGQAIQGNTFELTGDSVVTALFWPENALVYEGFDGFTVGSNYDYTAADSAFMARNTSSTSPNPKGDATFEIVTEGDGGALKVSATGATGTTRSWLDARNTTIGSEGSFVVEARVKTNNVGTMSYIRMDGVKFNNVNFQLRFLAEDFANYSSFPGIYNYSDGFAAAMGGSNWRKVVKYADDNAPVGEWYIVKIYVNKDAGTVLTEVWNGDGTTLLGSDTATNCVVEGGKIGFEAQSVANKTRENTWDYFTIKSWTPASN